MREPASSAALLLVAAAWMAGCGDPPAPPGADAPDGVPRGAVVDAAGRVFPPGPAPRRILSLVPSATETLLALGLGDRLVGRTDFDTAAALSALPSVGGGLEPSLELVVALAPDLVVRFAGQTDPRTPARLDDLGIAHVAVRPELTDDALAVIRDLGVLTHRRAAADSLLEGIRAQLETVRQQVAGLPPVRAAFLLDGTPSWAAGPGSFIGELMTLAGGVNVFHDLERPYAPVSAEALLTRDLEVVLTPAPGRPAGVPDGVRVQRVSELTQLPGPRLGEAAAEIARALHPGAVP